MRKIVVTERVTLDGVFDAATMAEWDFPYHSDARGELLAAGIHAADAYLLGRKTYQMLAPHWSALKNNEMGIADKLNSMTKYVASSTLRHAEWNNSIIIAGNAVEAIRQFKRQPGQDILVHGSGTLVHTLLKAGLVDELQLLVSPVIQGKGQRLFKDQMQSAALELTEVRSLGQGVVVLRYQPTSG